MNLPKAGSIKTIWQRYGRHIYEQTFHFSDGRSDDFFVFDTVKKARPVIIFPLTRDSHVVAIRQFRYGANETVLELPGGQQEPGQTEFDTLAAELAEETGYRPGRIVSLNTKQCWFDPASVRVRYTPLLALDCVWEKDPTPEENEIIEVVKFPIEEWSKLIERGEIEDSKTLAITLLVNLYFKHNPH